MSPRRGRRRIGSTIAELEQRRLDPDWASRADLPGNDVRTFEIIVLLLANFPLERFPIILVHILLR
jgi:hypothetical protein